MAFTYSNPSEVYYIIITKYADVPLASQGSYFSRMNITTYLKSLCILLKRSYPTNPIMVCAHPVLYPDG